MRSPSSTTCCRRVTSPVRRVMSEAELNLSISAKENSCILRNSLERSSVANPTEALEETNTFVMLASSPATEIPSIQIPMRVTTAMSRCMTPSSTMRAISMAGASRRRRRPIRARGTPRCSTCTCRVCPNTFLSHGRPSGRRGPLSCKNSESAQDAYRRFRISCKNTVTHLAEAPLTTHATNLLPRTDPNHRSRTQGCRRPEPKFPLRRHRGPYPLRAGR